ncbi:MAG TPA: ATP-binding protein [Anaeromyxobacteraceae bacterium]|nr:ATP-binding protein [Anaeromyxobacteraceae bacterium]
MKEAAPPVLEAARAAPLADPIAARVRAQAVGQLYARLPVALATVVVNAALVAWVLRRETEWTALAGWFAALFALSVGRLLCWEGHRQRPATPETAGRWASLFTAGALANGLVWGSSALLFLDGVGLPGRVLLAFVLGGMSAGAAASCAPHLPAFAAFTVPALAPMVVRLVASGEDTQVAMGAMLLLFAGAVTLIARTSGRSLAEAFRLRYEKEDLAARLAAARDGLAELARELEARVAERTADLEAKVQALQQTERKLADAGLQASVGRLAAGVAHEVNNPLACIMGNVQHVSAALAEGAGAERVPSLRQALTEALQGAARIREIVRSLSTLARARPDQPARADARGALETCLSLAAQQIRARACLVRDLAAVPQVVADAAGLCQVLSEVLLNAVQAIPPGAPREHEIYVTLRRLADQPAALVEIADTGVGVPERDRERVFEPFWSSRPVGQGLGLGLAVAQALVTSWGGRIALGPREGGGTVVSIRLRLADEG